MTYYVKLLVALTLIILPIISSQSYGNLSYSAVFSVGYIQYLPRLNSHLGPASKEFSADTSNLRNDYSTAVTVFPILTASLLFTAMALRVCCWQCCKPAIDVDGDIKQQIEQTSLVKQQQCQSYLFFVLFVVCCQGLLLVISYVHGGTETSIIALDNLRDIAVDLQTGGEGLDLSGNITFAAIQRSLPACPLSASLMEHQPEYQTSVEAYLGLISPVPGTVADLQVFLDVWGQNTLTQAMLTIYIVSVLMAVALLTALVRRRNKLLCWTVIVGYLLLAGMLIAWCLFLIALVSDPFIRIKYLHITQSSNVLFVCVYGCLSFQICLSIFV